MIAATSADINATPTPAATSVRIMYGSVISWTTRGRNPASTQARSPASCRPEPAVAGVVMPIDSLLVQQAGFGDLNLEFDDTPRHVLYHGHCQQKATFGTVDTHAMLKMIPNLTLEEVESGCCGMAGTFGYETEHYELSMSLAEMALAPAVRAAPRETIICATGTSCREQIDHTTARAAIHPIEVLAGALK